MAVYPDFTLNPLPNDELSRLPVRLLSFGAMLQVGV